MTVKITRLRTGRPSRKLYRCTRCGGEFRLVSNHWGNLNYSLCCGIIPDLSGPPTRQSIPSICLTVRP